MRLTESMIRDLVETTLTAQELGDLLTMIGFEVEEVLDVAGEKILDVNIMANRGDGASALGLAREILAKDLSARPTELYQRLVSGPPRTDHSGTTAGGMVRVSVEAADCTRYACRVFEGLANGSSPGWVQDRLLKLGQRPISLLVDLTNYVMAETGQPLHAFDLDRLAGPEIVVRHAKAGERLTTLDGSEHALSPGQLMICDAERPVAAAGVMGGADTEVGPGTTRCLLESAHFDHRSVRRTRKQLGLQTDASYRFERYVDPEGVVRALDRFADLLEQATGVKPVPGVVDVYPYPPVRNEIRVRASRTRRLLGMDVPPEETEGILHRLGLQIRREGDDIWARPPSWRIDLEREDDLIEEIGRIHGYEKIPELLPAGSTPVGGPHGNDLLVDRLREELYRVGLDQVIGHTLTSPHPLDAPGPRIQVRNPASPETAYLRNSHLPGLADAAIRNGGRNLHLFETGRVFTAQGERQSLAVLSTGHLDAPHWSGEDGPRADFFSLKGMLGSALKSVGVRPEFCPLRQSDPRFHPTRSAALPGLGAAGQIHPEAARRLGLDPETMIAEIDLTDLADKRNDIDGYRPIHRNPPARRDIAVVVEESVPYSSVEQAIVQACGPELERLWLFDVYRGPGVPEGCLSLAIALQFRKAGNFTDEEANQARDLAVAALEGLGARLR
jgi:phenylalanyl-tRNA synthetase beta chain